MPTYDYECSKCKHTLSVFQGINDKELRKCPGCGRNTLKKLIGAGAGIIFKGSGFYVNDYCYRDKGEPDKKACNEPCKEAQKEPCKSAPEKCPQKK